MRLAARTDADELALRKFCHGVFNTFAPDATLLDAPEGIHVKTKAASLVDPQRTNVHVIGKTHGMREAPGKYRALKPKVGIIGEFDGLVGAVERRHHDDRAEDLFIPQPRIARHARQNAGRYGCPVLFGRQRKLRATL